MEANNAIQTGIDRVPSNVEDIIDVRAYADDGEHATIFDVTRVDDTTVEVAYRRCEAGLEEFDCEERFDIDSEKTTKEWALECANADPEEAIKAAKDFWN